MGYIDDASLQEVVVVDRSFCRNRTCACGVSRLVGDMNAMWYVMMVAFDVVW